MRLASIVLASAFAACGGHSGSNTDGNGDTNGDGTGGQPTNVMVTLTDQPTNAATFSFIVAYQDGSSPWAIAPAPSGDTYTLPIHSAAYGVVWTCIDVAGAREVNETHFAVSERTSLTMTIPPRCTDRLTNTSLHGTITTANGAGVILARFSDRLGVAGLGGNPTSQDYAIETPAGTHDLVVIHAATQATQNTDLVADATLVQRSVAVAGTTAVNVNFVTGSAAVQSFPVTIAAAAANDHDAVQRERHDRTPRRRQHRANHESDPARRRVLSRRRRSRSQVTACAPTSITSNATATPAALTWTAPSPLGGAIATVMAAPPYPRITATWPAYPSAVGYGWAAAQVPDVQGCGGNAACSITWTAALSPGVVGATPGYTMPDLSMISGWPTALQLVSGTMVTGTAEAQTSTAGATDFPVILPPAAGTQRVTVRSDFTVTP